MSKISSTRFNRRCDEREERKVICIFTEGKETEPNYFKSIKNDLRLSNVDIKIFGKGYNTLSLVNYVIKNKDMKVQDNDEVWVVFDKDDFDKDFDNAIIKAKTNKINVAYSNESFELWFLLHFCYVSTALSRTDYCKKLNKFMLKETGKKYEKNSKIMYHSIKHLEVTAIKNAKTLLKSHGNIKSYLKKNPSTTVHCLVESLNKLQN